MEDMSLVSDLPVRQSYFLKRNTIEAIKTLPIREKFQ